MVACNPSGVIEMANKSTTQRNACDTEYRNLRHLTNPLCLKSETAFYDIKPCQLVACIIVLAKAKTVMAIICCDATNISKESAYILCGLPMQIHFAQYLRYLQNLSTFS